MTLGLSRDDDLEVACEHLSLHTGKKYECHVSSLWVGGRGLRRCLDEAVIARVHELYFCRIHHRGHTDRIDTPPGSHWVKNAKKRLWRSHTELWTTKNLLCWVQ